MDTQSKQSTVKSFAELRRLLSQTDDGMDELVHSRLEFGDMWLLPDEVTKFGDKDKHPWVVIKNYQIGRDYVEVSPRTTSFGPNDDGKKGIVTPVNVIAGLDKEGLILLKHRIKVTLEEFREHPYLGRLPEKWIKKLKDFQRNSVKSSRK